MKKLLIGVLLLCMVISALPAGAEENGGIGWAVSGQINREHFSYLLQSLWLNLGEEGSDEMLDAADALLAFINGFSVRGEAGKNAVKAQLCLNEQSLLEAGMGQAEDGSLIFDTSFLPGYVLTIPAEILNRLQARLNGMMQPKTTKEKNDAAKQFALGMNALWDEIGADFAARMVSQKEEDVAMVVQGEVYPFGLVTEYRLTGMDVFLGLKKLMNGTLPLLKDYLVSMGVPEEQVNIRLSDDGLMEENPLARAQIHLTCYSKRWSLSSVRPTELWVAETMVDGETFYAECMQQTLGAIGDRAFYLRLYQVMDGEEVNLLSLNAEAAQTEEENYAITTLDVTGTVIVLDVHQYFLLNGGTETEIRLYLNNPDAPLGQMRFSVWPLTESPAAPETEGKQVLDITMPVDDAAQEQLKTALQNGAADLMIRTVTAAPDEIEALMGLLMQMQ